MDMSDVRTMSALAQADAIDTGKLDPVELVEAYFDAIGQADIADQIYARLTVDRARREAQAARKRAQSGQRRSMLDGVPISWKDNFDSAGTATEAGTALLRGRIPERDAILLERARLAGLICLGKTHLSELAFSGLGYNPITATPPCVNDASAVPGGSSSGAAASVAYGFAAAGIGTDTGGSVRIPAAWNDLVGLKTTAETLPMGGVVPLCRRFDTAGPLTRTVADSAMLWTVLANAPSLDLDGTSLKGRRFAILEDVVFEQIESAPLAAFEQSCAALERAGAELVRFRFPALDEVMALSAVVYPAEAYAEWREAIEAAPGKMFAPILERFRAGKQIIAADYVAAWNRLHIERMRWAEATAAYDAVLAPTAPILPPKRERLEADPGYYAEKNLIALRNTRVGNLLGLCALTLPTKFKSCGMMMLGQPHNEAQLLRLGMAAERVLGDG